DWLVLISHMQELRVKPQGLDYVEIGTGWYPTLPLCYSLVGARRCRTYDLHRHLDEAMTFRALRRLKTHLVTIAHWNDMSVEEVSGAYERLCEARTLQELLERARIEYVAPGDASRTDLPDASTDVVFSNSVLEHVPKDAIYRIMEESRRILRPNG